ncbi:MAG: hypothetical protein U0167_03660 [bacterium]
MRVERIEIEGGGPLTGTFVFPADGVGLWIAPNDVSEGALVDAVAFALYGPPLDLQEEPPFGRVAVHVLRDDGTAVTIDRSLVMGSVSVLQDGVPDLSADGAGIGASLTGFSREEFLLAASVSYDDLRATMGDARLAALLGRASGGAAGAPATPSSSPASTSSGAWPAAVADEVEPLDIAIERAPFAAGFSRPAPEAPDELLGELQRFSDAPAASVPTERLTENASPVERLRHLRRSLATTERTLTVRTQELHDVSEKREELRAESGRLGTLADSEPADLERLTELADLLVAAVSRRDETARERGAFEQVLGQKGLDTAKLRDLEHRFNELSEDERDFLSSLDQTATIRRGNLALTRSECRLDETRIHEIERSRTAAARSAMVPLAVAAIGLFAALATSLMRTNGLVSAGLLLAGLSGGAYAAWTFWQARTLREDERVSLLDTLERKRRQIAELEGEGQETERALATLAARASGGSVRELRADWQRWIGARAALQDLEAFEERGREVEEHIVGLRAKLGAFDLGGGSDRDLDVGSLQAMIDDYQRSFRMRRDLAAADEQATQLEANLATIESERADLRAEIDAMLMAAGIDPSRNLDEAVEMFVLRAPAEMAGGEPLEEEAPVDAPEALRSSATPPPVPPPVPEPVAAPPPAPHTTPPPLAGAGDTGWIPRVSAAAEAILRRFLPHARDLEVDDRLRWSLRLDPRGARLSPEEVERRLSSAIVDQVCLALRLAIVETLSATGERLPVFLDEPWARADDDRHARGMELLVDSVAARGQVVLRTAHEVRVKWFLHQNPALRARVAVIGPPSSESAASESSGSLSASSLRR